MKSKIKKIKNHMKIKIKKVKNLKREEKREEKR